MNNKKFSQKNRQSHNKKIGWFCTYVPEEIITACGFYPYRITGRLKAKKSEGYFPINFCPFVKCAMEELLDHKDEFSGLIFTNSCDAMKRFYDTVKQYVPDIPAFILDVPRNKDELAASHYRNNISGMLEFLESINNSRVVFKDLNNSVHMHLQKRILLRKLRDLFVMDKKTIKTVDYFNFVKSSMLSDNESFINKINEYITERESLIKNGQESKNNKKTVPINGKTTPAIMLVGNFITEEKLWNIFNELGCRITAEDMCSSNRYFEEIYKLEELKKRFSSIYGTKNSRDSLLTDIALRYLFKPQCMRMSDLGSKVNEIINNIEKNNIRGLIFLSQKFCDNTLLFYPLLRQYLDNKDISSIFLEIEHNNLSAGQIKTRIQAFTEII